MNKPYVIFAPHIDDEVIGCFRYIYGGLVDMVYFFYECTEERKKEATSLSKEFGFDCDFDCINKLPIVPDGKIILVPNCHDHHEQHRAINKLARRYTNQLKFYSVDMNVKKDILPFDMRDKKKSILEKFYPSQSKLLSDEKYHLFESIVDDDLDTMYTISIKIENIIYTLQCDVEYSKSEFKKNLDKIKIDYVSGTVISDIIKDLICNEQLSKCSYISVTSSYAPNIIANKTITKTIYL